VPSPCSLDRSYFSHGKRRWWRYALAIVLGAGLVAGGVWLWHWYQVRQTWGAVQAALGRFDLGAAAAALDRYLELESADAAAWFQAARTARRRGKAADAERFLERCQQLGGVTDATLLEWDLLRVQQGRLEEIAPRLRMGIGPDHPDALLVLEALARGYIKRERLLDALQACGLWLERQTDHPRPWYWRGWIYQRIRDSDRALKDYRRAVELAPDDPELRLALGGLLIQLYQPEGASEHFQAVLKRSSANDDALRGLAACRLEQGRAKEAVALLDQLPPDKATAPYAFLLRGKAALQRGDFAGAEPWLRKVVERAPDEVEALHGLIQCLRALGRDAEVEPLAQRLEQLRRDLERLDKLIRLVGRRPDEVALRHEAGVIALRIGQTEEALRWLESALQCPGDQRPTHAVLAEHYRRQGDTELAEFHKREAKAP